MKRRTALKLLAGAGAAVVTPQPLWALGAKESDDFFVFVHAAGGWDVMLWADPRNERKGLVEPPSTENSDVAGLKYWRGRKLDGDTETFEIIAPSDGNLLLGPAIGDLYDFRDRLTIINGIEMNTVSHPDGVAYSITGRHLTGGHPSQASVDVVMANELGASDVVPAMSIGFPSTFLGRILGARVMPLRMANATSFSKALARSDSYLTSDDRDAIAALLKDENSALTMGADRSDHETLNGQLSAQALLGGDVARAFDAKTLQSKYAMFDYKTRSFGKAVLSAPFVLEALQRNLARCVSFSLGGLDTHNENYRRHGQILQDLFNVIAMLVRQLESTKHPTRAGVSLLERTHIVVFSDFCRTPQITLSGGRDHYPNNSALIISPRFRRGTFGRTDAEQLLPSAQERKKPFTAADLLATFIAAFDIDPKAYLRDGRPDRSMLS